MKYFAIIVGIISAICASAFTILKIKSNGVKKWTF